MGDHANCVMNTNIHTIHLDVMARPSSYLTIQLPIYAQQKESINLNGITIYINQMNMTTRTKHSVSVLLL